MRRGLGIVLAALAFAALCPVAAGESPSLGLGQFPRYEDPQEVWGWEGHFSSAVVRFPSARTKASLYAVIDFPKPKPRGKLPAVVIVPGSGPGVQSFYQWAARDLAGHGYIAMTVDPQGVGRSETFGTPPCNGASCPGVPSQQAKNYVDAFRSGLNYLVKRKDVDTRHLGAAGHSLAARSVSYIQGKDRRLDAIVAWDNLASNLQGDAGVPTGNPTLSALIGGELPSESEVVKVRVPALGMASDQRGFNASDDPDRKKTAYTYWRKHGRPSMELVFLGSMHNDWAQTRTMDRETAIHRFAYYTRAWFDRYLRGDLNATKRLLAKKVLGKSRASFLSVRFHSAASLDGYRCENLLKC